VIYKDLKYAVFSILSHHGFEPHDKLTVQDRHGYRWVFSNDYNRIDIHFTEKIKEGKFGQPNCFLKLSVIAVNPYKLKPMSFSGADLHDMECILVDLNKRKPKLKPSKYGYCAKGHPFVKRYNQKNDQYFLGCSTYPDCNETKSC
jgi:hypothetical protein